MIAVFLIGIISFLYLRVKRMTKQFRNGTNSNANRNNTRRQQQNATSGSTKRRSAEYDDGVVVEEELYDERSPHQANRKIFAKDEGEYVDLQFRKESGYCAYQSHKLLQGSTSKTPIYSDWHHRKNKGQTVSD